MHELMQPNDDYRIPGDWDFLGKRDCSVVQIDIAQRFLSVSLEKEGVDPKDTVYKGHYADYFFGSNGKPLNYLRHAAFDTFGNLRGDGLTTSFRIHEWHGPKEHANLELTFKQLLPHKTPYDSLADVRYESLYNEGSPFSGLEIFGFGRAFHPLDTKLTAPSVSLGRNFNSQGFTTNEWIINPFDDHNGYEVVPSNQTFVALRKDGSLLYTFQWDIIDGVLVAKLTELSTGFIKTMEAPLRVDMRKVGDAIFQRAPYQKDEHGFYDVPWMNLANIVGARLIYEQPLDHSTDGLQ